MDGAVPPTVLRPEGLASILASPPPAYQPPSQGAPQQEPFLEPSGPFPRCHRVQGQAWGRRYSGSHQSAFPSRGMMVPGSCRGWFPRWAPGPRAPGSSPPGECCHLVAPGCRGPGAQEGREGTSILEGLKVGQRLDTPRGWHSPPASLQPVPAHGICPPHVLSLRHHNLL